MPNLGFISKKMNITRENLDALNAVVKVDIAKEDYSDKVRITSYNVCYTKLLRHLFTFINIHYHINSGFLNRIRNNFV